MTVPTLPATALVIIGALCMIVGAGGIALVTYQVCNWGAEIKSRSDASGLFGKSSARDGH